MSLPLPCPTCVPTVAATLRDAATPVEGLRRLQAQAFDRPPLLPFPAAAAAAGAGATLARWQVLAAVGGHDLALAKLFEGHTDALAILHEAGHAAPASTGTWGTWCAEPPGAQLLLRRSAAGLLLDGRKGWCSGARSVSHAIVSCHNEQGDALLAAVDMGQAGIEIDDDGWRAVGMRDAASAEVRFTAVPASVVGAAGFYVGRAGFWHGGAGVAACWHGACVRLADALQAQLKTTSQERAADPHRLAQMGEVAVALQASAALMRASAAAIDARAHDNAMVVALSLRLAVEAAATVTLAAVGRALGAGPLCRDSVIARLFADLPVFIRQSHAERDQAALGAALVERGEQPWTL